MFSTQSTRIKTITKIHVGLILSKTLNLSQNIRQSCQFVLRVDLWQPLGLFNVNDVTNQ